MADQQSVARIIMAVSSVVVAVCAVVVTVKVAGADLDPAEPPRVLDQAALEQLVATRLQGVGDKPVGRVTCPGSVQVVVGNQFDCETWDYLRSVKAHVEIVSDQGEIKVTRS
ncbi:MULTISPECIES: DUF4333 domain-containing protein [Nocardia]|uniref:DUF4333 domain-containing protein n=1 Tax=Nocardia TaxID=1817 RepID=UPI000BF12AB2|nr:MULTISPECIES: DUF4333 domain-containing protein [Nocardia]PEH79401.1 hypothetical protein CRM89_28325 [Nocardia sp. FDAARGOS_372]